MYKVNLTYFKHNGSFYSGGEYTSDKEFLFEIFDEVREMERCYELPGLRGNDHWLVLVDVPDHPDRHPHLIVPRTKKDLDG